jgi:hypothetical protein
MAQQEQHGANDEDAGADLLGEVIGPIWVEPGPDFSSRTRLALHGIDAAASTDKEKVSLTLDRLLLQELRTIAGPAPLSTVVNELLHQALEHDRLRTLAEELVAEAGEPSPEAYERVLGQWFRDEG